MDKKDLISSHRSNVYGNFLMHWKYIKREKVGDKWKYTYKDDAVTDARTKLGKSVIDYKKAVATENKLNKEKTKADELLTTSSLNKSDARVNAQIAMSAAKRAVEKARKEYDAAKAKSDASIGNRITKALNGEKSTKDAKDKGVVEKKLSNGVTYTVPYDEKLDGPREDKIKEEKIKEEKIKEEKIREDVIPNKTIPMTDRERNVIEKAEKKTEPKVSKEYKEEVEFNSKKNAYPKGSKSGDEKKEYTKLEDFFGKDERDALVKADNEYTKAEREFNRANESKEYSQYITYDKNTGEMIKLPGYDEARKKRGDAMVKADKAKEEAGKKATEARDEFFKTPYGMLYQTESMIDDGRAAVGNVLEKLAKKLKTPKASIYKY